MGFLVALFNLVSFMLWTTSPSQHAQRSGRWQVRSPKHLQGSRLGKANSMMAVATQFLSKSILKSTQCLACSVIIPPTFCKDECSLYSYSVHRQGTKTDSHMGIRLSALKTAQGFSFVIPPESCGFPESYSGRDHGLVVEHTLCIPKVPGSKPDLSHQEILLPQTLVSCCQSLPTLLVKVDQEFDSVYGGFIGFWC